MAKSVLIRIVGDNVTGGGKMYRSGEAYLVGAKFAEGLVNRGLAAFDDAGPDATGATIPSPLLVTIEYGEVEACIPDGSPIKLDWANGAWEAIYDEIGYVPAAAFRDIVERSVLLREIESNTINFIEGYEGG